MNLAIESAHVIVRDIRTRFGFIKDVWKSIVKCNQRQSIVSKFDPHTKCAQSAHIVVSVKSHNDFDVGQCVCQCLRERYMNENVCL